jgi:hypothetical protein
MKTAASVVAVLICTVSASGVPPEPASVTSDAQVRIAISVAPQPVGAGSDASVTIKLDPKPGIKMNKYPKIKLQVPAVPGLTGSAEQSLGNTAPPPADQLDANYFHGGVDPLNVTLHVDADAAAGRHEIHAKLSYFYCVAASGYCAPAKAELTIPVTIR